MKKFKFSLEKLLDYKDQLLEGEQLKLGELNAEMRNANDKLEALYQERIQCKEEFDKKTAKDVTPTAYQVYFRYDDYLKEQIELCKKMIQEIQVRIDRQVDVIKNLKLETRSLELLRESKQNEYNKEVQKKEEEQMEEFVNTSRIMKKVD